MTKKAEEKRVAIENKLGSIAWTIVTDSDGSKYFEGYCRIMQKTYCVFADGSATVNGLNLDLRFYK